MGVLEELDLIVDAIKVLNECLPKNQETLEQLLVVADRAACLGTKVRINDNLGVIIHFTNSELMDLNNPKQANEASTGGQGTINEARNEGQEAINEGSEGAGSIKEGNEEKTG